MQTHKEILPANLTTQVKDSNKKIIQLYIEIIIDGSHRRANFYFKEPEMEQFKQIGSVGYYPIMDFQGNRCLEIGHMKNLSSFTNVGTALHEHVFRESYELDCGGHVRLYAGSKTHYFHYRCGFSPYPPNFYPEVKWIKIFAKLRAKQPEGMLYLSEKRSYHELHLSDEQIQRKVEDFNMKAPIVAISRDLDLVNKKLLKEGKIQLKVLEEDNEEEAYKFYTRP